MKKIFLNLLFLCVITSSYSQIPSTKRSEDAIKRVSTSLEQELRQIGATFDDPVYIRIFKEEKSLEVWKKTVVGFKLFKSYDICTFSGGLGPKIIEGDGKSPEGFYYLHRKSFNPWSDFHLSLNLGFPNSYDRYHGRTGSFLMIHGEPCASIGCYSLSNEEIEEIYTVSQKYIEKNTTAIIRVHIFPFRMTEQNLSEHKTSGNYNFWLNLKDGYEWFEKNKTPPNVTVREGEYFFTDI